MNPPSEVQVLLPQHKDAVLAFAKAQLARRVSDPTESELQSWTAPWRAEALDHYLNMGWSYGLFEGETLVGFLLAQPLLFYRGLTQTLWVEHVSAPESQGRVLLLDTAYRWARDKHFQCVLVEGSPELLEHIGQWRSARQTSPCWIEIRSAKF